MSTNAQRTHYLNPVMDMWESNDEIRVVADVPGLEESALILELEGETLTLRGDAASTLPEASAYQEFPVATYFARMHVGPAVDRENIAATLKHGTLTIRLPKTPVAQPRRIDIAVA